MGYSDYTEIVFEHFMAPYNSGTMPDADAEGRYGEAECGDALTIYIKVRDNIIEDITFLAFGCVAAIASSSMTTVLAKGKSLDEAYQITDKDISDALGGLPEYKLHCSVLGEGALKNAIDNYRKRQLPC
ncbi:iron-sulfur cluster assembly scaffold protein NifU [Niameybacter massiliensis]|uniref:Iron-sulfur cluster assembly scaffold protein NifU n=1 Tax=Holtiella tumoricola TaxID=3018743 RepID=A0AA42J3N9_9FIRM|nr:MULTISPECIES: iron-sulfur cluster assembly scaffold protein NifU [Lachnospirales]MDA3734058.1 iron-sulfur cluster assembly scaffold protein NifU [Holtiella tumoricola]